MSAFCLRFVMAREINTISLSREEKSLIRQAALQYDITVAAFIRSAALKEAKRLLRLKRMRRNKVLSR